jgi:quinol monooxygenase YgiN
MEDENRFIFLEEWDTEENLKAHLESEQFKVLRGAMNLLLKEPYEMTFNTRISSCGQLNNATFLLACAYH